ncbi:MAG: toll/interleukin-1 receptor domain-containing protein [Fibrobacter sp.]|jgi:cell division protein FtsL|nr:toll/interleukin-1 receptor domain-containing protein [Fibrobacter sp.]
MAGKFDIFISYRRKGGYDTAKLLYDRLRLDGYSVSFDIDTLEKGNFDDELEKRVHDCKDFILVLSPGVFDRFFDPNCIPEDDWVRREISCALRLNKNIVPLALDGFAYPSQSLPADVKDILRKNVIDLSPRHFESAYTNLKTKFLLSKQSFATRHKKSIIAFAAAAVLVLAACAFMAISAIYAQKDLEAKEAELKAQELQASAQRIVDSLRVAKESEIARATDSIARYIDSVKKASAATAKPRTAGTTNVTHVTHVTNVQAPPPPVPSSSGKTLHWRSGSRGADQIIFDKIKYAGIEKSKCSGNNLQLTVNKASCKVANVKGQVSCNWSPKLTVSTCDNRPVASFDSQNINTGILDNEELAKKSLETMARQINLTAWVSDLRKLK